jgi:hypothetical protein
MIAMNDNLNDILVAYLKYVLFMNDNLHDRYEWFVVSSLFNLHEKPADGLSGYAPWNLR